MNRDVIVVGSGPNGLSAAITLQRAGVPVILIEGKDTIGGGMRTQELTLPGFLHDVCSAVHPMAAGSPFFKDLPLNINLIHSPVATAHPFDGGHAAVLLQSIAETSVALGKDAHAYRSLIQPVADQWEAITEDSLGPFAFPRHPLIMARFGFHALRSAANVAKRFSTMEARGLWAGMSAHAIQSFNNAASAAIGMVLCAAGHRFGWPVPEGGSQSIANALAKHFTDLGGRIETGKMIRSMNDVPPHRAVLFDLTPKQLLAIAGERFSSLYKWELEHYRLGPGVFKVDWALKEPIPFTAEACRNAATVHIGNTFEEIAAYEQQVYEGRHAEKPFVLLSQQSLFDKRAPDGQHVAWAYCHVPNGSTQDMTDAIEKQVERFAPGFRDIIIAKHTMNTEQVEAYNPNYTGGDINGGLLNLRQLYTRPAVKLSPYRTSAKGIYICSSATPPGGGVHGMCGYHAAQRVLKDLQ